MEWSGLLTPTPCGSHSHTEFMQIRSTPLLRHFLGSSPKQERLERKKKADFKSIWSGTILSHGLEVCRSIQHSDMLWRKRSGQPEYPTVPHSNASWIPQTILIRKKIASAQAVLEIYGTLGKGLTGVNRCAKHTLIAKWMDKRSNQRLSALGLFQDPFFYHYWGATALSETSCSCYCWLGTKSTLLLTSYIKWTDKQLNCWPLMAFTLGFVSLHKEANILHAVLDGVWNCAARLFRVHTLNPIVCVQCFSLLMPNTVGLQVIF